MELLESDSARPRQARRIRKKGQPPGPPNDTARPVLRAALDAIRIYVLGGGLAYCCDLAPLATCDSQVPVRCPEYPVLSAFYG